MPHSSSLPARLLQSPRAGFGVTILALVGVASTSTGLLVSHGTNQLQPPAQHVVPPSPAPPALTPVVVDRAPGTFRPPAPAPAPVVRVVRVVRPVAPAVQQPGPGTVPVVPPLPPVETPDVPDPVVEEPPVLPPGPDVTPDLGGKRKKPHRAHPDDKGKHLGQHKH